MSVSRKPTKKDLEKQVLELKKAELEYKNSIEQLRDESLREHILVKQSRDGIVILDKDGKVYEANQQFADMLGYSMEEVSQLYLWDWDAQFSKEELLEMARTVDDSGAHFETQNRRKDGTIIDVELSNNGAIFKGEKLIFCICRDITDRKILEEKLRELSVKDELTGLYNRRGFFDRTENALRLTQRIVGKNCFILFVDVDNMKKINDEFGHQIGDQVVCEVASILNQVFRESDIIARVGGDEFLIFGLNATPEHMENIVRRIDSVADTYNALENRGFSLSLSYGIAFCDADHPVSINNMIMEADRQMYEQKRSKKQPD